jgi:DNA-binding HxlR family transcriptional regulator
MKVIHNRSDCPIGLTLDDVGDRWSLLIIRDMMFAGKKTYNELINSREHIATNILADRLQQLTSHGFIRKVSDPSDGRKTIYQLTEKGVDLMPLLEAYIDWGMKYKPGADYPKKMVANVIKNKDKLLEQARAEG